MGSLLKMVIVMSLNHGLSRQPRSWCSEGSGKSPPRAPGVVLGCVERCRVADEERAEADTDLEDMQNPGVRNRRVPEQTPGNADDQSNTPNPSPTTSTSSGTFTPGTTDGVPESSDFFIKAAWQRLFNRLGEILPSRMSAEELKQQNRERGHDQFKQLKLDEYPEGFPQLAALISCDDSLAMHRSFKYCHNRVILQLEVQITELEKELYKLDKEDAADPDREHRLKWTEHEEGWDPAQQVLIDKLTLKLKEYVDILRNQIFLQGLGQPPSRNHRSYFNWHWTRKPLLKGYYDYIFHDCDFVNTSGKRPSYCEELIRDHIDSWPGSPISKIVKVGEGMKKPTDDQQLTFFSASAEKGVGRFLLVSSIMLILMIPVFLLFLVQMSHLLMAVTTASFIFLFALIMSAVAEGRVYEVFVGTATQVSRLMSTVPMLIMSRYGAVLIMFLGNISQNSPGSG